MGGMGAGEREMVIPLPSPPGSAGHEALNLRTLSGEK